LYTGWIENLLDGNGADAVLVSEEGGRIAGYITFNTVRGPWQTRVAVGDVPLNAVSSAQRGRGHYTDLVNAVFSLAHERGCAYIHIRTQLTAVAVHAAWTRRGARMVKSLYSFHAVPEERV
jgi:GNAT superfamily N-acetyltransferase